MPNKAAGSNSTGREERRRSGRSRTLIGGTIVFRDGTGFVQCVVRNRTETGTQLEIPANQLIPRHFYLVTAKDNRVYEAELVWKKANRIGVAIGRTIDLSTTHIPALQFLKKAKAVGAEANPAEKTWDDDSRWPI